MEFPNCDVKSVKADIANGGIRISFDLALNDDSLAEAHKLGMYVDKEHGKVKVIVVPNMPDMFLHGQQPELRVIDQETGEVKEDAMAEDE